MSDDRIKGLTKLEEFRTENRDSAERIAATIASSATRPIGNSTKKCVP